jgi:glutathione S-transferase
MLWPLDLKRRAMARAYAAEMHSGFQALRANLAMNTRKIFKPKPLGPGVEKDIARIAEIWRTCLTTKTEDGPFLFGPFGAVDAMYAPVVSRFQTYQIQLDPICTQYMLNVMLMPEMQQWYREAEAEPWSMENHDSWGEEEEELL